MIILYIIIPFFFYELFTIVVLDSRGVVRAFDELLNSAKRRQHPTTVWGSNIAARETLGPRIPRGVNTHLTQALITIERRLLSDRSLGRLSILDGAKLYPPPMTYQLLLSRL